MSTIRNDNKTNQDRSRASAQGKALIRLDIIELTQGKLSCWEVSQ